MDERIYGLLGRKLGHSWSVPIHAALGNGAYRLLELEPDVNTIVRCADGKLVGYNTDIDGFLYMACRAGISLSGKKVVILGSGGGDWPLPGYMPTGVAFTRISASAWRERLS